MASGHGACQRVCPGQLLCKISYSYLFYREMHFISRIDVNFLQNQRNVGQGHQIIVGVLRVCQGQ